MAGSDAVCLHEITEALQADHQALETAWISLRDGLMQIANGGNAPISTSDVETWVAHYEQHIQREEDVLLPMAARLLSEAALEQIGRAMCARRGLTFLQK